MSAHLDSAIAKAPEMPEGTTLYRGVNFGRQGMPDGAQMAGRSQIEREAMVRASIQAWAEREYTPGKEFSLGGYQSTSETVDAPLNASHSKTSPGVLFEISGKQGAAIHRLGKHDDEYEYLLSRDAVYRVVEVKNKTVEQSGGTKVPMTVIKVMQKRGKK
jgi:hypothetical protein